MGGAPAVHAAVDDVIARAKKRRHPDDHDERTAVHPTSPEAKANASQPSGNAAHVVAVANAAEEASSTEPEQEQQQQQQQPAQLLVLLLLVLGLLWKLKMSSPPPPPPCRPAVVAVSDPRGVASSVPRGRHCRTRKTQPPHGHTPMFEVSVSSGPSPYRRREGQPRSTGTRLSRDNMVDTPVGRVAVVNTAQRFPAIKQTPAWWSMPSSSWSPGRCRHRCRRRGVGLRQAACLCCDRGRRRASRSQVDVEVGRGRRGT